MKKTILFFTILLFCYQANAQINLVPNPSFEQYDTCPVLLGELEKCKDWYNYGNSPDYFNECAVPFSGMSNNVTVPINSVGVQHPASGKGYIGLITHDSSIVNYREYIGCKLINHLQIGTKYFVSFRTSLADSSWLASNNIGINLTLTYHNLSNPISPLNKCTICSNQIISDSANWSKITGSFIADSAYEYLMVGNFFQDNQTALQLTNFKSLLLWDSYYYIDDICLSTDSAYAFNYIYTGEQNIIVDSKVKIYPNPANDLITFSLPPSTNCIEIRNLIGQTIYWENVDPNIKSYTKNISSLPNGLYLLIIKTNNNSQIIKFVKQ